eukprot:gene3254-3766_t
MDVDRLPPPPPAEMPMDPRAPPSGWPDSQGASVAATPPPLRKATGTAALAAAAAQAPPPPPAPPSTARPLSCVPTGTAACRRLYQRAPLTRPGPHANRAGRRLPLDLTLMSTATHWPAPWLRHPSSGFWCCPPRDRPPARPARTMPVFPPRRLLWGRFLQRGLDPGGGGPPNAPAGIPPAWLLPRPLIVCLAMNHTQVDPLVMDFKKNMCRTALVEIHNHATTWACCSLSPSAPHLGPGSSPDHAPPQGQCSALVLAGDLAPHPKDRLPFLGLTAEPSAVYISLGPSGDTLGQIFSNVFATVKDTLLGVSSVVVADFDFAVPAAMKEIRLSQDLRAQLRQAGSPLGQTHASGPLENYFPFLTRAHQNDRYPGSAPTRKYEQLVVTHNGATYNMARLGDELSEQARKHPECAPQLHAMTAV